MGYLHRIFSRTWRRIASPAPLALTALLVAACVPGCEKTKPVASSAKPLTIIISGDTDGWITPCGCTSNQSGGLLRRGSYVAGLRQKSDVVYADVGGAVRGSSEYDRVKFGSILAGEKLMGVFAHNIGKAESELGCDALRDAARNGAPLVSANVRDEAGQLVAQPLRISETGGRRIAVTGVLSPRFAPAGVRVDDPRQAILAAIGGAKGSYDSLLVLAYLPQDELEQLAAALPEADAVIGGPTGQPVPPRRVGPTLLASATSKGKFLVVLDVSEPGKWAGSTVEMDAAVPDQASQQENLKKYLDELGRRDLTPTQTGLAPPLPPGTPADYRIAGSSACVKCHAADDGIWEHTQHAQAWQTLVSKHFEVDPQCMQCHTTGYGLPGGFESRAHSAALVSVGCEDCHGPSAGHVLNPKHRTPFRAKDQCVQCHDHENSPKFEYAAFWGRIKHGPTTQPAGGT
ncbi:MAG: cycA1 [Phycisphaerales bacterium]|nr:cycA1 [Phycisphaerales bacterium]